MFSFGTRMFVIRKRPVAVPLIPSFGIRGSIISKPSMSGVTRNAVTAVLPSLPGTGVRAITVRTCAIEAFVM